MKDEVLVTGSAGSIGSHPVDELVRRGHPVDVIDNLESQVHRTKPAYLSPGAAYRFRDIRRVRKELDGSPRVLPEEGVGRILDSLGTQLILRERIGAN